MPVRIEQINFDQTTLTQDYTDNLPGGGGSGTGEGTGGGSSTSSYLTYLNNDSINLTPPNNTTSNLFIFNISTTTNVKNFQTIVNGTDSAVGSSKQIRITRESLANQSYKIEVKANGYTNLKEYYMIEMVDDGAPIIINPRIEQPLGLNTKDVVLTLYRNGKIVGTPKSIRNTSDNDLTFTLRKLQSDTDTPEEPTKYTVSFNITGKGSPVSILKNGNKSAEFFPNAGNTEYQDVDGTKYTIRSSDTSLYRITSINLNDNSKVQNLVAEPGETLELDITLTKNYSIEIKTEEIFQGSAGLNPQIELLKTDAREYNINSKVGVPLMFRKNEDVKTITVIVGDDVLEFDDLDKGTLCGITIPHSVFKNIGKYNIQIFPFSLDDYENEVRPPTPADTVEAKKVTPKYEVKEEVKLPEVTLSDNANLYKPRILRGSGLSGGNLSLDGDYFDSMNLFTNREDFIQRPNINEAIR